MAGIPTTLFYALTSENHFYIGNTIFAKYECSFFRIVQYGYFEDSTEIRTGNPSCSIEMTRTAVIKSIEEIDESTYSKAKEIFEMASKSIELLTK